MRTVFRRVLLLFFLSSLLSTASFAASHIGKYILYVGTYTQDNGKDTGSKGIYAFRFKEGSGKLKPLGVAAETINPSFLAAAPDDQFLYAVNEVQHYQGAESSGAVTAFSIDLKTGKLKQLDEVASRGADPCFIAFDKTGRYVLVANYTGGNVAVFHLASDGKIEDASSVQDDQGQLGPVKDRQEHAHAHWIEVSAHNRFAYVSDLGLDRVLIYKFDAGKGTLSRGESAEATSNSDFYSAKLAPGTGPRHVAFSADGKFMYVLGEIDSTVTVFANDGNETFRSIQKISTLPPGFSGENTAAEIEVHPDGKFLYTSNRGDDSIAVFQIDTSSGKLTFLERVPSGGKTPRHFAIGPGGKRLLVANEETGNIVEFKIDTRKGTLKKPHEVAKVPAPVCLVFVPQ
jgi:6-phosphogluconolactonase